MDVKEAIEALKIRSNSLRERHGISGITGEIDTVVDWYERTRWIPVSESPKESTDCLLSDGDDITIAFYSKSRNHFYSGDDIEPCATHWMLLPESPGVE